MCSCNRTLLAATTVSSPPMWLVPNGSVGPGKSSSSSSSSSVTPWGDANTAAAPAAPRKLAATPTKRCSQRADEANALARKGWKLKFTPFFTPEKCPQECRKGSTVPPGGVYTVKCTAERCGCQLSTVTATGQKVTRLFAINRDGVFDDKSSLGPGCPSVYYSKVECLGAQAWCKPGEC
jgi:hypothetical protein